jgi:hypothetical protein
MRPPLKNGSLDDYQTPGSALVTLLPYLKKQWVIWECADGEGYLSKALRERGFQVIATDIHNGQDFLKFQPEDFDVIVTNPPYSLKDKFLERAYELGKPFAFLLPLTTLEGRARQLLFSSHGISLLIPDRRTNFITPDGRDSGSWFLTAWFTWQLLDKDLVFRSCIQQAPEVITDG